MGTYDTSGDEVTAGFKFVSDSTDEASGNVCDDRPFGSPFQDGNGTSIGSAYIICNRELVLIIKGNYGLNTYYYCHFVSYRKCH